MTKQRTVRKVCNFFSSTSSSSTSSSTYYCTAVKPKLSLNAPSQFPTIMVWWMCSFSVHYSSRISFLMLILYILELNKQGKLNAIDHPRSVPSPLEWNSVQFKVLCFPIPFHSCVVDWSLWPACRGLRTCPHWTLWATSPTVLLHFSLHKALYEIGQWAR